MLTPHIIHSFPVRTIHEPSEDHIQLIFGIKRMTVMWISVRDTQLKSPFQGESGQKPLYQWWSNTCSGSWWSISWSKFDLHLWHIVCYWYQIGCDIVKLNDFVLVRESHPAHSSLYEMFIIVPMRIDVGGIYCDCIALLNYAVRYHLEWVQCHRIPAIHELILVIWIFYEIRLWKRSTLRKSFFCSYARSWDTQCQQACWTMRSSFDHLLLLMYSSISRIAEESSCWLGSCRLA